MTHPLTTVVLVAAVCLSIAAIIEAAAAALLVAFLWELFIFYQAGTNGVGS